MAKMDTGGIENIPFFPDMVPGIQSFHFKTEETESALRNMTINPKSNTHIRCISDLLASSEPMKREYMEKLLATNIKFSEFSCLSDEDLKLIGIKGEKNRQRILNCLKDLPHQVPSLEFITKQPDAQLYNETILMNAADHINTMWVALAGANSKLISTPVDDCLLGEKYYASRFVLNSLTELDSATNDIKKELAELETLIKIKKMKNEKAQPVKRYSKSLILIGSVITSAMAFLWFWKINKTFT